MPNDLTPNPSTLYGWFYWRVWCRVTMGMDNPDILIHGFRSDTAFWCERDMRARVEYALANSWVLQYDFGHRELLQQLVNRVI